VSHSTDVRAEGTSVVSITMQMATHPRAATRLAQQAVLRAFETSLTDGLRDEHVAFRLLANSEERQRLMRNAMTRMHS